MYVLFAGELYRAQSGPVAVFGGVHSYQAPLESSLEQKASLNPRESTENKVVVVVVLVAKCQDRFCKPYSAVPSHKISWPLLRHVYSAVVPTTVDLLQSTVLLLL